MRHLLNDRRSSGFRLVEHLNRPSRAVVSGGQQEPLMPPVPGEPPVDPDAPIPMEDPPAPIPVPPPSEPPPMQLSR
ncbi:hypothetical protein [Rhizosaccharibacter radicis]|uniref:Uncharacterized protein n=1 Tax=Rhizosaccharibacter radicis TaxID=2782605 RepID=A0ABT1VWZ8_9PROT|nr:hypothetical protein [Acetobacteraceae bacterium KSS12]